MWLCEISLRQQGDGELYCHALFVNYYNSRIRNQVLGIRDQGSGKREKGAGNIDQGTVIRDQETGIRLQGSGIREQETMNC